MSLTLLVLLPFIASVMAALLPSNARNTESTLAGLVALWCCVQTALYFPQMAAGGVLRQEIQWLPALGLNLVLRMDGFAWMFCMLVLGIGALVVLYARYYMSAADPVPRFFCLLPGLHGRHGGRGAVGQPDPAGPVLGADQPVLLPADRLLAPPQGCTAWRPHGADRDRHRAACACWRACWCWAISWAATTWTMCWPAGEQVRDAPAVPGGAGVGAAGRADQERAVPLPLLAAARHGSAHPGVGLPALGHHGQGRRVSAGAAVAGAGRHGCLVLAGGRVRGLHAAAWRPMRPCSRTTSRGCWPIRPSRTWV